MFVVTAGLPPDSMAVDRERLYWTSDMTIFIYSVDKLTGLNFASDDVPGSADDLLAFGDNLQPFPGKPRPLCQLRGGP